MAQPHHATEACRGLVAHVRPTSRQSQGDGRCQGAVRSTDAGRCRSPSHDAAEALMKPVISCRPPGRQSRALLPFIAAVLRHERKRNEVCRSWATQTEA